VSKQTNEKYYHKTPFTQQHPYEILSVQDTCFSNKLYCPVKENSLNSPGENPSFSFAISLVHTLDEHFLQGLFRNYPNIASFNSVYVWKGTWKVVTSDRTVALTPKDIQKGDYQATIPALFLEKSLYLYEYFKDGKMSGTVEEYFQSLTGCPVLRFPFESLSNDKIWLMLQELTVTKKYSQTQEVVLATPSRLQDMPFTLHSVE
jgi:hypothetical protein